MGEVIWTWPDHEYGEIEFSDTEAFRRNPMLFHGLIQVIDDTDESKDWHQNSDAHEFKQDNDDLAIGCVKCSVVFWGELCEGHVKELRAWQ